MSDVKLGTTPAEGAQRDAIHVAVSPEVAGEPLRPGQHVRLIEGHAYFTHIKNAAVGIVDPFRHVPVKVGERFWLLLYQNTVVGMRHHWSHPAFSDAPPQESRAPASEAWLREFAQEHYGNDYDTMMARAREGDLCFGDDIYPEDQSDEFWLHFNAVTGLNIKGGYFRCAC